MLKIVVDDSPKCKELLSWIEELVPLDKRYLLNIVVKDEDAWFIENQKITKFPVLYSEFSSHREDGLLNIIRYLRGFYHNEIKRK